MKKSLIKVRGRRGALSGCRQLAGVAVVLLVLPLLMWLFGNFHSQNAIAIEVLCLQLFVVVVALVGGLWPALFAAVCSGVLLDLFYIEPKFTVEVADPVHLIVLFLHIATALLVSFVVDRAARQRQVARRAAADSELLQSVAGSVLLGQNAMQALLKRTGEVFQASVARLVEGDDTFEEVSIDGDDVPKRDGNYPLAPEDSIGVQARIGIAPGVHLELHGSQLVLPDQRLLDALTAQMKAVIERRRLEVTASEIEPIAASDRVRGALLSALSHDLRRPLAAATTAIGGLRSAGEALSPDDRQELLDTAEESLAALTGLVTDLLDVSRVQAGVLAISLIAVDPMDIIAPTLEEIGASEESIEVRAGHGRVQILADPVLLQRALVNLLVNALRFTPTDAAVTVSTRVAEERVEIRVIDHGPGVPVARRNEVFVPFQRLGDTDNTSGLGLGLALSRGFVEAMQGTLELEDTPEGGLTMVVSLEIDRSQGRSGFVQGEGCV